MDHSILVNFALWLVLVVGVLSLLTWFLRDVKRFLTEAGNFWRWVKNWYSCL